MMAPLGMALAPLRLLQYTPVLMLLTGLSTVRCVGGAAFSEAEVARVKCAVCQLAMAEASTLVVETGLDLKSEDDVIDFADSLCTLSKREGRWLRRLDVKDTAEGKLKVENMTFFGECRNECLMVRKACSAVLDAKQEELVELLRSGTKAAALSARICKQSCKKKLGPLKQKRVDEEFIQGPDAGMLQMMENRDKLRAETGQVFDVMKREDMDSMSDGDREAQAAQDAFAEQLREARERSGLDWKGTEL